MALTWVCFSFIRLCRKTRLHPFWPLSHSVAAAVSLAQSTPLITNSQWCFVSSNKILTAGKFRYIVPACVQTLCVSHNGCSVCFKMLFLCSFPRLHCIVITFRWDTWKRSESKINLHALLTAVFRNVDTDTVTRLIINPSPLWTLCSPLFTFSSPPHGRGLLCWGGRGHCQCEGCTGDQDRPAEEHRRGAHQHLGTPVWPLCPVLHWDLGEMLHGCEGMSKSGGCIPTFY